MPMQARREERRELRRGAGPLKAEPRILLPRGVRYGGRPAGLLTRGSPFAAFPACTSGVDAKSNSPYSGGTVPDSHRVPSPCARFNGEPTMAFDVLSLAPSARVGGRDLHVLVHSFPQLGAR